MLKMETPNNLHYIHYEINEKIIFYGTSSSLYANYESTRWRRMNDGHVGTR